MTTVEQVEEGPQPTAGQSDTGRPDIGVDVAAVCLRFVLGILFLGHGLQKAGWFKAPGWPSSISEQADFVGFFGYSDTNLMAWLITVTEVTAGALFLLGLLTPLAAAAAIGVGFQFVAGPQWDGGLFGNETTGGFDQALVLTLAAVALGFIGAGRFSLDSRMPSSIPVRGLRAGVIAVALGVVVGAIVLIAFGVGLGGQPPMPDF